jgi:group I intron endonuclease
LKSGIYRITNKVNGKIYIGSAVNFSQRWGMHLHQLRKGSHHSVLLQRAFNKYGEDCFLFEKIILCAKEDLIFYEQIKIDEYKPYNPLVGYNICTKAGSSMGVKMSDKNIKLMKNRLIGNKYTLNYKHSSETKERMSLAHMGNKNSVGHKNWLGKKHSEETKARMSDIAKSRPPMPEELKKKISESLKENHKKFPRKSVIPSEETREKMRLSHLGKSTAKKGTKTSPHSEDTKRKISEGIIAFHARKKNEKQQITSINN